MLARRKLGQPFQSELVPHLCTAPSRTRRKWPASQGTHSTPGWRVPVPPRRRVKQLRHARVTEQL